MSYSEFYTYNPIGTVIRREYVHSECEKIGDNLYATLGTRQLIKFNKGQYIWLGKKEEL